MKSNVKSNMKYDVIIIGAGPAGLNCAYHLSRLSKNLKILIVEKNRVIGPKVCAGGLLNHDLRYLRPPAGLMDRSFSKVLGHGILGSSTVDIGRDIIHTIDRKRLGQWMASRICGRVKILTGRTVTDITDRYIVLTDKSKGGSKIHYNYLVGADGSSSMVRKYLGLKTEKFGVGMQYILPKKSVKKYQDIEFFFNSRYFGMGYAWIFPHKDSVSIGCGCSSDMINAKKLRENLDAWLKKKDIDVHGARFEACIMNHDYRGYRFGRIFLAGDAAGLISVLSGEGIYTSLISGEEVARLIHDKDYDPAPMRRLVATLARHEKIFRTVSRAKFLRQFWFEIGIQMSKREKLIKKYSHINEY
jgi:geranylgeranyl reductase